MDIRFDLVLFKKVENNLLQTIKMDVPLAHVDPDGAAPAVRSAIIKHLEKFDGVTTEIFLARRFDKFSRLGRFAILN
jgi:acetyl-CoA carboxylase alpha subunit